MKDIFSFLKNRAFLGITISVILAFFGWITSKLSGTYSQRVNVGVKFVNIPSWGVVSDKSTKKIGLQVEGTGLQISNFELNKKDIEIDINKLTKVDGQNYLIPKGTVNFINYSVLQGLSLKAIYPDTLKIVLEKLWNKEVEVESKVKGRVHPEYRIVKVKQEFNRVQAFGAEHLVDTLHKIKVVVPHRGIIKNSFVYEHNFEEGKGVKYTPKKMKVWVDVIHVGEGVFMKNVVVLNGGDKVKVFPKEVEIVVTGDIKVIKNMKYGDIIISANYLNRKNGRIPLVVMKKPEGVDIVIERDSVDYLREE